MRKVFAFLILIVLGIGLYFVTGNIIDRNKEDDYDINSNEIKKENILKMAKNDYFNLLSKVRDLQETPDQIMNFNAMVMEVLYSGKLNDSDIELLVNLQREYYSSFLLEDNPEFVHIEKAKEEIKEYKKNDIKIIGHKLLASPEYIGDKDRAIVKIVFYLNDDNADIYEQYFLKQNSDDLWEIVGWSSLEDFTVTE